MNEVLVEVKAFLRDAAANRVEFFNEAELQHELGYWLRTKMPRGTQVYFERPADAFFSGARGLVKKEIDLVISPSDRSWHFPVELKCPRNGRIPETMFDACRDIQFLEQLSSKGFSGGLFLMHVTDLGFYQSGSQAGIYSYFRAGRPIPSVIPKPTGSQDQIVNLRGNYRVEWQHYESVSRYWLQPVTNPPDPMLCVTP